MKIRDSYDAVAEAYAREIGNELPDKPVDRALYGLFAELVGVGARVADVGCGPGHVGAYLAGLGLDVVGIDLSPKMIEVATARYPAVAFRVGDMTAVGGLGSDEWAGAVCPYSIVHFGPEPRAAAFAELARVIRPGGWLLLAFHTASIEAPGTASHHSDEWWGHEVDLDFQFIDPARVTAEFADAGFELRSRTDREPWPDVEAPSRRSYLLCRLRARHSAHGEHR
ncbi:MAG TPA: class I SAM-dependent methyltransferase [Micromonosporaceae bacterium]